MKDGIQLYCGDCLEVMRQIPDGSVDMVICDLPYGTTACKWDSRISLPPLWKEYERLICDDGAIVLFGTQPFTTTLISSRMELYRYSWVWVKEKGSNFQLANIQPLKRTEDICVFSKAKCANGAKPCMRYFPILEDREVPLKYGGGKHVGGELLHKHSMKELHKVYTTRHPINLLFYTKNYGQEVFHPTQKPTDLLAYLIRTYTKEGETVLDNCMGSGSTGVACVETGRNFVGIEKEQKYFDVAKTRIEKAQTMPQQQELGL